MNGIVLKVGLLNAVEQFSNYRTTSIPTNESHTITVSYRMMESNSLGKDRTGTGPRLNLAI